VFVGHLAEDMQPIEGSADGETTTFRVLTGPKADAGQNEPRTPRSYEVVVRDHVASVISGKLRAGTGVLVEGQILDHSFQGSGPDTETVTKIRLEAMNVLSLPNSGARAQSECEGA